jgi:[protein-PII] uridylyltransferase
MMQHQELRGMTARTLRALWRARLLVNGKFRKEQTAKLLFLHLLQQPRGIVHEFRRMNQYGILGRYLPEFGKIVGQMQHDLFHVYTVDQHILMVLRNLRRFTMPGIRARVSARERADERLRAPLAAVRGRALSRHRQGPRRRSFDPGRRRRAPVFQNHGLSKEDSELVEFLVERHLAMSHVAQKQDVYEPEVVQKFAELVGSERRLVALYLFTVADVRGTSPKVWNAWKGKLLEDLFRATRRMLTGEPLARDAALAEKQAEAARLLRLYALSDGVKDKLWVNLDTAYFLRHDPRRSRGRRATCTTVSTPTSRWSRRASRPSARGCR